MPATNTQNEQVIEAAISGPDGANRLITCTGQAWTPIWLGENQQTMPTYTFLVGPELPRPEFYRAIASASVTSFGVYVGGNGGWHSLSIESVEADWDDESGRTQVRVELNATTGPGINLSVQRIGYTATVLGETPA
jgi:hypothetical protein